MPRSVDRRSIAGRELALGQRILVLGNLLLVGIAALVVFCVAELGPSAELGRSLELHADRVVARVSAAQVGIAPRRPRRRSCRDGSRRYGSYGDSNPVLEPHKPSSI